MSQLIEITEEFDVLFDLRYATSNNVCNRVLYKTPTCYLHKDAAKKLEIAVQLAKKQGYKIKIFDGYRPISVQKFMFEAFPANPNEEGFISNPKTGAIPHCRGVAIDLTLVEKNGDEVDMGSDFDEFSSLAFHDCDDISKLAQENRKNLLEIMTKAGFDFYSKEWWHYQLFQPREFEIIANFNNLSAL
ncbi:MAG: D-alanyl-D-alanine dipeptidase [Rickettsiales bacterium]|nr:D-alanyl-D-alanine dipeptidase [Rickettsiales bacterium]